MKVYDDGNDTFHCKNSPPTSCPNWDDKFNFEPSVWKCEERELDANALDAAERIKGCFGSGSTIHKFWNNVQRFEYGTCPRHPKAIACVVSCSGNGANNVVRFNKAELAKARLDNSGQPIDATVWQWFAEALNHELRHVSHNATYDCGRDPSNPSAPLWGPNSNFWSGEQVPSFVSRDAAGEQRHTINESLKEYEKELGVTSPFYGAYNPAVDRQLPYCRLW